MTPSTPQRVAEVPAAQRKAFQVKEEPDVDGETLADEQARAIIGAAQRALEEAKAAGGGAKPSPVLRSLQRFLAQKLAAADVQRIGDSTSS